MTTTYTDAQLREFIEKPDDFRPGHTRADLAAALLAERKAAIQPQGGAVDAVPEYLVKWLERVAEQGSPPGVMGVSPAKMADGWNAQLLLNHLSAMAPQHVNGDGVDVRGDAWRDRYASLCSRIGMDPYVWNSPEGYAEDDVWHHIQEITDKPVRSVSDADVIRAWSVFCETKEQDESVGGDKNLRINKSMRAALEAFLKGGEGHE